MSWLPLVRPTHGVLSDVCINCCLAMARGIVYIALDTEQLVNEAIN